MYNFGIPDIQFEALAPVLSVAITGLLVLIAEMLMPKRDNAILVAISIGGLIFSTMTLLMGMSDANYDTASQMFLSDPLARVLELIIVIGTGLTIVFSEQYLRNRRIPFGEFYPLVLWSATGAMIMCSTQSLMMIFIGLEILSIALYVMAGMAREERRSEESAMKYFLLGAFASGFLLYGIAMIYGATGSLHLDGVRLAWEANRGESRLLLSVGFGLMLVGLSFKAGFVPFHQWTPDVYQGAPTNVTAFMATVSKIGAFGALWRLLDAGNVLSSLWIVPMSTVAILTMLFGNVMALAQKDVKRVLAYSSISHAGYILVAVLAHGAAPQKVGIETISFYLLSYTLMTVGSFAIVAMFARGGKESTKFEDLNGLWERSPAATVLLIVFMLSLIGIPPLSGFFGKALIFTDALNAGLQPLAIVLAISSIISVSYYLRIALEAIQPDKTLISSRTSPFKEGILVTAAVCALGVIATTVFYAPLMESLKLGTTPSPTLSTISASINTTHP